MAFHRLCAIATLIVGLPSIALGASSLPGRELVVALASPDRAEVARAAAAGASGVLFVIEDAAHHSLNAIPALSAAARKARIELWVAKRWPCEAAQIASLQVAGLALIVPTRQREVAGPRDLEALLEIKRKGDRLGQRVRHIKAQLGSGQKLALCLHRSETRPETAISTYVPVNDLIRDGTVDVVCLSGGERLNFHRLRLLRDGPLRAGAFIDGQALPEKARAGVLSRAVLAAAANDTCDGLWVTGVAPDVRGQVVAHTLSAREREQARRAAIQKAIAAGTLVIDQEVSGRERNNQATVHGVGQSFVPSRDGRCPLVQVYACLRGCRGPLPPALKLEIREDAGGKPGNTALATTEIRAAEFGHEPTYRWGSAQLEPAVALKKGAKYWIYLPPASHPEGGYVWGIVSNAATERGNAWSCRYDYLRHTWVFRVFMEKEARK